MMMVTVWNDKGPADDQKYTNVSSVVVTEDTDTEELVFIVNMNDGTATFPYNGWSFHCR